MHRECAICLEVTFASLEGVIVMPCGHVLHQSCWKTYIRYGHAVCPTCRTSLIPKRANGAEEADEEEFEDVDSDDDGSDGDGSDATDSSVEEVDEFSDSEAAMDRLVEMNNVLDAFTRALVDGDGDGDGDTTADEDEATEESNSGSTQ